MKKLTSLLLPLGLSALPALAARQTFENAPVVDVNCSKKVSATAPGSREWARGMAVPRSFLGRIPSVLSGKRLGHGSHDAHMLCSRVCGSISKEYLARCRGPFCRE